ncbi:MAG: R3H domain-containing nucleic acid-binding protein [bacterium]|nr:R3H domain-containing nucleic acid-binding protein [bacterium]
MEKMEKTDKSQQLLSILNEIVARTGLTDASVEYDSEANRFNIIVDEHEWFKKWIPDLVKHIKHILDLAARKLGDDTRYYVDINNYRKERERLITELARAAAKKAMAEKRTIALPAMNSYERRLVHTELSMRPDIETESIGEGRERHITVKAID